MLRVFLTGLLAFVYLQSLSQEFHIDAGHTAITSKVKRFGMVSVLGRFTEVEGTIGISANDPTSISVEVIIKTASYTSNNLAGEEAVKSQVFLDTNQFPEIRFKSKEVKASAGQLQITGDLTIHGITREVTFPFSFKQPFKDPTGLTTIAVSAILTINRQDFGITFSRKLPNGNDFIGNEVEIELNVLAFEK
jgi:polyisoprenoid-binding protein YceI